VPGDNRSPGSLRLRKLIDVIVEDKLSFTLFRCAVADISPTGMRIISDQYLARGDRYTFTMKNAPHLTVRGEVRWIRPLERDTFQCGILFFDISSDDSRRLTMFLDLERQRFASTGEA
jgi:hypothetical protein